MQNLTRVVTSCALVTHVSQALSATDHATNNNATRHYKDAKIDYMYMHVLYAYVNSRYVYISSILYQCPQHVQSLLLRLTMFSY